MNPTNESNPKTAPKKPATPTQLQKGLEFLAAHIGISLEELRERMQR